MSVFICMVFNFATRSLFTLANIVIVRVGVYGVQYFKQKSVLWVIKIIVRVVLYGVKYCYTMSVNMGKMVSISFIFYKV